MSDTGYQPKKWTWNAQRRAFIPKPCTCRKGMERDNCPQCEGTGQQIDFKAIREKGR